MLLTPTFILLGIGDMGGTESIIKAGGYVGVLTALAAVVRLLRGRDRVRLQEADHPTSGSAERPFHSGHPGLLPRRVLPSLDSA